MPGYIDPCDPVLRKVPPSGDDWLYEIKWDGYRAQLHIRPGKIIVYSRKGFDWTDRFAAIALAAKDLRVREAVIDGEAVVLGSKGIADFQALRRELGKEDSEKLTYYAFDLLWLNGKDLRSLPLVERKQRLRKLIDGESPRLVYVEDLSGNGQEIYKEGCRLGPRQIVHRLFAQWPRHHRGRRVFAAGAAGLSNCRAGDRGGRGERNPSRCVYNQ